jgi:hypothetical protein
MERMVVRVENSTDYIVVVCIDSSGDVVDTTCTDFGYSRSNTPIWYRRHHHHHHRWYYRTTLALFHVFFLVLVPTLPNPNVVTHLGSVVAIVAVEIDALALDVVGSVVTS